MFCFGFFLQLNLWPVKINKTVFTSFACTVQKRPHTRLPGQLQQRQVPSEPGLLLFLSVTWIVEQKKPQLKIEAVYLVGVVKTVLNMLLENSFVFLEKDGYAMGAVMVKRLIFGDFKSKQRHQVVTF